MSSIHSKIERTIVKTLAYSDIFNYPLTKEELWRFLISSEVIERQLFEPVLKSSELINKKGEHYFIKGRLAIVKMRTQREKESRRKMRIAKRAVDVLSKIPTIELIGISGGLALMNADKEDDIDLFLIVSANTLWISRFLVLVVLEGLGIRRKKYDIDVANKICCNMITTEDTLYLPGIQKDIYTAHEIIQLKVVFDRKNIYKTFLFSNRWIEKYMPNTFDSMVLHKARKSRESFLHYFFVSLLKLFESLAKKGQFQRIQQYKTTELVSDSIVAFHTTDYRKQINKTLRNPV